MVTTFPRTAWVFIAAEEDSNLILTRSWYNECYSEKKQKMKQNKRFELRIQHKVCILYSVELNVFRLS